jgi:hypothetical protein
VGWGLDSDVDPAGGVHRVSAMGVKNAIFPMIGEILEK